MIIGGLLAIVVGFIMLAWILKKFTEEENK